MQNNNILSENVYSKKFKGEFLVMASCLPDIHPEIAQQVSTKWKNVVCFCLEQFHYNQFVSKLFDILAIGNTNRVGFITPDGSPHCVQMHFASKYLKRGLNKDIEFEHYVADGHGKVFQVSMKAIDKSKNLSLVGKEVKI